MDTSLDEEREAPIDQLEPDDLDDDLGDVERPDTVATWSYPPRPITRSKSTPTP
jgi:hypothetical protein